MPERINEMNDLATMSATVTSMTLKEITDMLDVRHNNAMRTVAEMEEDPAFGSATQIEYHLPATNRKRAEIIKTYQLDKRQSISVAAHLNVALLMRIIDRWQELETKQAVIGNDHYAAKLINLGLLPGIVDWWQWLLTSRYYYQDSPSYTFDVRKPTLRLLGHSYRNWLSKKFHFSGGYSPSDADFKRAIMVVSGCVETGSICGMLSKNINDSFLEHLTEISGKQVPLLGR
jgi:phage regulator Rha-like protein